MLASPATARASSVLPVPGPPVSRHPFGRRAPNRVNLAGYFKKSTYCFKSSFAYGMPMTSLNVVPFTSVRYCFDFSGFIISVNQFNGVPLLPDAFPPLPAVPIAPAMDWAYLRRTYQIGRMRNARLTAIGATHDNAVPHDEPVGRSTPS